MDVRGCELASILVMSRLTCTAVYGDLGDPRRILQTGSRFRLQGVGDQSGRRRSPPREITLTGQVLTSGFANETIPVFGVICEVQQVNCWRSAKTKEPKIGSPDKIERCRYVFEITRVAAELDNELTGGWKVLNVSQAKSEANVTDLVQMVNRTL